MNNATKLVKLVQIAACRPNVLIGSKQYIFIVSHMRSYSSLLSHILGSHSDISGYSEMHLSYFHWWDLAKLRCAVYLGNNNRLDGRFVLDSILHNRFRISESIIDKINPRVIFLLRRPEDTLKSIMNMGIQLESVEWYKNAAEVIKYYRERLEAIQHFATIVNRRGRFVEAETLVDDTDRALASLSEWLGLKETLESKYSTFEHTGAPGYGDPSGKIQAGEVIRERSRYDDIHIPQDILAVAETSYAACRATLLKTCGDV